LLYLQSSGKCSRAGADRVGVLFVSPESPRGRELMRQYLERYRCRVEDGDPVALRQAIDAVLLQYGPAWLHGAWRHANLQSQREEWRGFVVYLVAQYERGGQTRKQAFAAAGAFVGCSKQWVEKLFREPASRPFLKLFRIPLRSPSKR
jgi:hypothetical protein